MTILAVALMLVVVLRVIGVIEPLAVIAAGMTGLLFAGVSLDDFALRAALGAYRVTGDVGLHGVLFGALMCSVLGGCDSTDRRPQRPLGLYAPGDAGFVGALVVAALVAGGSVIVVLLLGAAVFVLMRVGGAIARTGTDAPEPGTLGRGLLASALILPSTFALIFFGIATPIEALACTSVPITLVMFAVPRVGKNGGLRTLFGHLVRGTSDAAWIVAAVMGGELVFDALKVGGTPTFDLGNLAPMLVLSVAALAVMVLAVLAGPTVGPLLFVGVFNESFEPAAGGLPVVTALAMAVGYASPFPSGGLLSPTLSGGSARPTRAEIAAFSTGIVMVLIFAAASPWLSKFALSLIHGDEG